MFPLRKPRSRARAISLLSALRRPPSCSPSCAARFQEHGIVTSTVISGKEAAAEEKFRDYYAYSEALRSIPSHRALALFRGRGQGVLSLELGLGAELEAAIPHPCAAMIAAHFGIEDRGRPADKWLADVCRWTWRVKAHPHISTELLQQLREAAEAEAIKIFGRNLHELLLAAPAGPKTVLGLDPGLRTGCKVAVVDATGKLLETATVYPHQPRNDWQGSLETLAQLIVQHGVELISIGNGTASRETDKLAAELIKLVAASNPERKLTRIVVSEAGASVYSASALAAAEFPELDVSLRGAVSIARRLQDPLAELVKINPRSIGVGQYQHDVNQRALARSLDATVEDCVNAVGVDLNTASVPLLARVSGLNSVLAKNIVGYRDANGPFPNRDTIRKVPRLGDKTFEQAAGFLRISNGDNPLDRSSVHPEAYPVVERILQRIGKGITEVMGQPGALEGLTAAEFTDEKFGVPTVRDILAELEKPGRDPRPEFKTATFRDGIESLVGLAARHDPRRCRDQRCRFRRLRGHRGASGRPRARLRARQQVREEPPRRRQARPDRSSQGGRGRREAPAHRADHALRRCAPPIAAPGCPGTAGSPGRTRPASSRPSQGCPQARTPGPQRDGAGVCEAEEITIDFANLRSVPGLPRQPGHYRTLLGGSESTCDKGSRHR